MVLIRLLGVLGGLVFGLSLYIRYTVWVAATEQTLIRWTPEDLADVDRVRGGVPRGTWIKAICVAAVRARDEYGKPCVLRVVASDD